MNLQAKIEAYADAADCMDDATLGKIFRKLIEEAKETRQRVSEQNRANVRKRYSVEKKSTKSYERSDSDYETPTKSYDRSDSYNSSPSPTPLTSHDNNIYINNINNKESEEDTSNAVNCSNSSESPKRFVKPTMEEVQEYIREKNLTVNAEKFYAFYEAGGWMVGKRPMKSWKMALIYWQNNGLDRSQHPPNKPVSKPVAEQNYTQREYTDEQLDSLIAEI